MLKRPQMSIVSLCPIWLIPCRKFLLSVAVVGFVLPTPLRGEEFHKNPGSSIITFIIPPSPPGHLKTLRKSDTLTLDSMDEDDRVLKNAPVFDWTYGCGATTSGMLAGYYDRVGGLDNLYVSGDPDVSSLCPRTALSALKYWGKTIEADCPFIASKKGVNGRTGNGHVDDYWYALESDQDPCYGNWEPHSDDCTADFTGTSIYHDLEMRDGYTGLAFDSLGYKLVQPLDQKDLASGIVNYFQSRGYTVNKYYSQLTQSSSGSIIPLFDSFDLEDFQAEIESGRPVPVVFTGHVGLGIGYRSGTDTIYVCDTWGGIRKAQWNGDLAGTGLRMFGVVVVKPDITNSLSPDMEVIPDEGEDPGTDEEGYQIVPWTMARKFYIRHDQATNKIAVVIGTGADTDALAIAQTNRLCIDRLEIKLNSWDRPDNRSAKVFLGSKGSLSFKNKLFNINLTNIDNLGDKMDLEDGMITIELIDDSRKIKYRFEYLPLRVNTVIN